MMVPFSDGPSGDWEDYESELPEPTPQDYGVGMTVCIAAYSAPDRTILSITDRMASMNDSSMSSDDAISKARRYGEKWISMSAGSYSALPDVERRIRAFLRAKKVQLDTLVQSQLADAVKYAFESEIRHRAKAEILTPYGLDFDNYRNEGPKLGDTKYAQIVDKLGNKNLGLHMLLAGFSGKEGRIFSVQGRGLPQYHGISPWAIGSGQLAALGYLCSTQTNSKNNLATIFYRICCAKFAAETSLGVDLLP